MRKKKTNPVEKRPKTGAATNYLIGNSKGSEVGIVQSARQTPTPVVQNAKKPAIPHLIPQPGGRGALLSGGLPGNPGGGRTPEAIRGTLREIIEEHGLPYLKAVLSATGTVTCPHCDGEVEVPKDPKLMAKLLDTGLRIGVGAQVQVEHQGVVVVIDGDSLSG